MPASEDDKTTVDALQAVKLKPETNGCGSRLVLQISYGFISRQVYSTRFLLMVSRALKSHASPMSLSLKAFINLP